jgi:predicted NBD/HSP70 family sugar kinase
MMNSASTASMIRSSNRANVLREVLLGRSASRTEIAKNLSLTKTTLTNIISELIEKGILTERPIEPRRGLPGRQPIGLGLSEHAPVIFGMDIQRDALICFLADLSGSILKKTRCVYPPASQTIEELKARIEAMHGELAHSLSRRILAAGISAPGPMDVKTGFLLKPFELYTDDANFDIVGFVSGLVNAPTFMINDAAGMALAEKLMGRASGVESFMAMAICSGIGGSLYLEDRLYEGMPGRLNGIGHTTIDIYGPRCSCGNVGCLEMFTGMKNVVEQAESYRAMYPNHPLFSGELQDIYDIMRLSSKGDVLASVLMVRYCEYLSRALYNFMSALDLETVVVGCVPGDVSESFVRILDHVLNTRVEGCGRPPVRVIPSAFSESAFLYGATAVVLNKLFVGELTLT